MMRAHLLLLAAAFAALASLAAATATWADTAGCPVPGIAAVCPAFKRLHVPKKLARRGIEHRSYAPGVWAYIHVNASSFGSAAASTSPALNAYTGGANEAGFHFHDTAPSALKFHPSRDFAAVGRAFVAARFLDVASTRDAPPPTQNAMIRTCKTGKAGKDNAVFVANWTSASPLPGPPTASTVLAHTKALAAHLDEAGERYCARSAWLLSYAPDTAGVTGRHLFEVTLASGRCRRSEEEEEGCGQEDEVEAVPRPALVVGVGAE
jgi:hypothetical protein